MHPQTNIKYVDSIMKRPLANPVSPGRRSIWGVLRSTAKTLFVVMVALVFTLSQFVVSLSALQSTTIGAIAVIDNNLPAQGECEGAVMIKTTLTGSFFDYGNKSVIMTPTGQINAEAGELTITTLCDFTMESGAVITANGGNGGDITLEIGHNIALFSGSIIEATGEQSSESTGGTVIMTAGNDFTLEGRIDVQGKKQGGNITLAAGHDLIMLNTADALAPSGSSSEINKGGIIKMTADNIVSIAGTIDATAQEHGGIVEVSAVERFLVGSTGQIKVDAGSSDNTNIGGNVSLLGRNTLSLLEGNITSQGHERGGKVTITNGGNVMMSGSINVDASSNVGSNRGGTIVISTPMELSLLGSVHSQGQEGNGLIQTNYCTKDFTGASIIPAATEYTSCAGVVINEILADPVGLDTAVKPDGEWVELFNYSTSTVDVAGWMLADDTNSHELAITSVNTDTGSTQITGGGFLVVYRNGDADFTLNNSGDQVRLFNGIIGDSGVVVVDEHTYATSKTEGNSYARIPDGGVWYDPEPTPGQPNEIEEFNYFDYNEEPVIEEVEQIEEEHATSTGEILIPDPVLYEESASSTAVSEDTNSTPVQPIEEITVTEIEEVLPVEEETTPSEPQPTPGPEVNTDDDPPVAITQEGVVPETITSVPDIA